MSLESTAWSPIAVAGLKVATVCGVLVLSAAVATARGHGGKMPSGKVKKMIDTAAQQFIERLDGDADGLVSLDEYAGSTLEVFTRADDNTDARLGPGEFASVRLIKKQLKLLESADKNGDGSLSKKEFLSAKGAKGSKGRLDPKDMMHGLLRHSAKHSKKKDKNERAELFEFADVNGDRMLDTEELANLRQARRSFHFSKLDTDSSQFIEREEFLVPVEEVFGMLDLDGNALLDRWEVTQAMKKAFRVMRKHRFKNKRRQYKKGWHWREEGRFRR